MGTKRTDLTTLAVREYLAMESEAAKAADALAFMARFLCQATIPHSNPGKEVTAFGRRCGEISLSMQAGIWLDQKSRPQNVGLPYGTVPRLLLAWMTTEAVKTKSPELVLGRSLSQFMHQLGLVPTGGRWGTVTRLKDQARRLFAARVTATYGTEAGDGTRALHEVTMNIADEVSLWWNPRKPDQPILWESSLTLGERFFREVTKNPVPVDSRALRVLRRSPMQLDQYFWLTYRMFYLKAPVLIPWEGLAAQMGADFKHLRQFKAKFIQNMTAVLSVYPKARIEATDAGLKLLPSPPHVLPPG